MAKLVIVSNRVSVPQEGHRAGGLEVAVRAALKRQSGLWFGWSGRVVVDGDIETRTVVHGQTSYVVTDLIEADYQEYYNGFANRVLWPILHYRLDLAEFSRHDLGGYLRVNEHFANELSKLLEFDDVVWVHDYHLLPLARLLRERGHRNRIGFFLHIPLPPPDILTALPQHERLIAALVHYDLVGFQTNNDRDNFARYLISECHAADEGDHTFTVSGRRVTIGAFPVGIETAQFTRLAQRALGSSFMQGVIQSLSGRAMMIGVDRLDYSKGLTLRLDAFERFLASNPDWRNNVTYIQITPRSRGDIPEYSDIEKAVSATAGRINGAFGDPTWTPIRYVNRAYSRSALAGLYRTARVGLVTPLRDGMNLVAKEYVAAQDAANPGVLVLSRFVGAAVECKAALLVNPYDAEAVGNAIARALAMSLQERRARHELLMRVLSQNDIRFWAERFLAALGKAADAAEPTTPRPRMRLAQSR